MCVTIIRRCNVFAGNLISAFKMEDRNFISMDLLNFILVICIRHKYNLFEYSFSISANILKSIIIEYTCERSYRRIDASNNYKL